MKKTLFLLGLVFMSIQLCVSAPYPLITNISGHRTISLDGMWKYIVDPQEIGYYDYRKNVLTNGFFLDKPQKNPELIEYDFDEAPSLRVPGDWNTQDETLLNYEGTIWYRKKFSYNPQAGQRVFLYFGAVNYKTIVFLNGKELGKHEGGFTPFNFEVTNLLQQGNNSLVLKVDNTRRKENIPTDIFDWWNYGGITRSVMLVETPEIFIRDYSIQLSKDKDKKGHIVGWVQLDGGNSTSKAQISIPELKKEIEIPLNEEAFGEFDFKANPELWSPEHPRLYDIVLSGGSHSIADKVGFRTIEVIGNKIVLNGESVFCRGVCVHEEAPFRSGRAYSVEDARTLIRWAKEMNCNFLRLAHYTHNENMIREAEKEGIMLWTEIPVYWTIDWENAKTLNNAKNQMKEMITRDKNRCNIIIWSVANETPQGDARLSFLKSLIAFTRSMDNSRLISAALEKEEINPQLMTINDSLSTYLDVLSLNQYLGWYGGSPNNVNWKLPDNKPIIISEFGGGALANKHGDKSERWTEEYHTEIYEKSIQMYDRTENITGTAPWVLMDFRSPRRLLHGTQDCFNRKGLISNFGEKKEAFFTMKEWYSKMQKK